MKLRALAGSLLVTIATAGLLAGAAQAATILVAPETGDVKRGSCFMFGGIGWGPNGGFVYKNVPAFTLAPGDKIGFDTWAVNNTDIGFNVALAATTTNGGDIPAGAFATVVSNTQLPRVPRGNAIVGDYDLEFTASGSFTFPGGGLVIRFSQPSAAFAPDVVCTPNLVGAADPNDASGYFVERFRQDPNGVHPWSNVQTDNIGAFQIVNAPPALTGTNTGTGTGTGGSGGGGTSLVDRTRPTLGGLAFSATTFKAAKSGASIGQRKKRRSRANVGTKVSYRLSEPGSVKFTVERKTSGRRVSGRCKARTRKNAKRRRCTRWVKVRGSFTHAGKEGKNGFTFRGRIRGKALKPASYRLNSQATDKARNRSPLKRKSFKIVL